jgi:hypothetical protein
MQLLLLHGKQRTTRAVFPTVQRFPTVSLSDGLRPGECCQSMIEREREREREMER